MKFEGCQDFMSWLVEQGFKVFMDGFESEFNMCNWYACRYTDLPHRRCENDSNLSMQLVVKPYQLSAVKEEKSVTAYIRGESKGLWFQLKAYGMAQDEFTQKLPEIESALVNAWNAVAQVKE